jgi:hypothetical protein
MTENIRGLAEIWRSSADVLVWMLGHPTSADDRWEEFHRKGISSKEHLETLRRVTPNIAAWVERNSRFGAAPIITLLPLLESALGPWEGYERRYDLERIRWTYNNAKILVDTACALIERSEAAPRRGSEGAKKEKILGIYFLAMQENMKHDTPIPGDAEIARRVGCDRSTVFRALKGIREHQKDLGRHETRERQESRAWPMSHATETATPRNMRKKSSRYDD